MPAQSKDVDRILAADLSAFAAFRLIETTCPEFTSGSSDNVNQEISKSTVLKEIERFFHYPKIHQETFNQNQIFITRFVEFPN